MHEERQQKREKDFFFPFVDPPLDVSSLLACKRDSLTFSLLLPLSCPPLCCSLSRRRRMMRRKRRRREEGSCRSLVGDGTPQSCTLAVSVLPSFLLCYSAFLTPDLDLSHSQIEKNTHSSLLMMLSHCSCLTDCIFKQ